MMTTEDAHAFWQNWQATPERIAVYANSSDLPSRQAVIDGLRTIPDVHTVLELGCHCGPVLHRLAAEGYAVRGIDANYAAVMVAKAHGFDAVVGLVPAALARYADASVDVIVTSYCLSYLAPEDLIVTLRACLRIVRRGLVLAEPMVEGEAATYHRPGYAEWHHDVMAALVQAHTEEAHGRRMTMTRIPVVSESDLNGVIVASWDGGV